MDTPRWLHLLRRWRLVILTGLVFFAVLAIAATVIFVRLITPRDPYKFYVQGVKKLEAKEYGKAFELLQEAALRATNNARYFQVAAEAASAAGRPREAARFSRRAWDLGLKTPEQARFIINHFEGLDKEADLKAALELINELPEDPHTAELRGDVLYYYKQVDQAIAAWKPLVGEPGISNVVAKIASAYLNEKQPLQARAFLEEQRQAGHLNEAGYALLAALYTLDDEQYAKALEVFEEASHTPHYGDRLRLEHGVGLLIQQQPEAARKVLETIQDPVEDAAKSRYRTQARLFLGFLALQRKDRAAIEALQARAAQAPAGPWKEGEQRFYRGLLGVLDGRADALVDLRIARKLIPEQAAIELVYAGQSLKAGNFDAAIASCRTIEGTLHRWPPLLFTLASALHQAGRDPEALQVLNELHRRNLHSKESLELLRDVAYGNRLPQLAQRTQQLLEQRFPDDADIKLYSGYAAMRTGAFEKAEAIFQELVQRHPAEVRFRLAQVQLALTKGENERALQLAQAMKDQPAAALPFEAIAHARLQQWDAALAAFEKAVAFEQPAEVHLEYGKLLLRQGRMEAAVRELKTVLAAKPDHLEATVGLALAAYRQGKLDEARAYTQAVLSHRPPPSAEALLLLAHAEMRRSQYQEALDLCQSALAKDPDSLPGHSLRGALYLLLGRLDEAERDFQFVLQREPKDLNIRQQLALLAMRRGNFPQALQWVDGILAEQPDNAEVKVLRFEILASAGQIEQATRALEGLKSSLPPARYALSAAWLAQLRHDTNAALTVLQPHLTEPAAAFQWVRLKLGAGAESEAWQVMTNQTFNLAQWVVLAETAENTNLRRSAAFCYERALQHQPDNPALLNNWAWNAMQCPNPDFERIISACRRALEAMPMEPKILDTYAEALLRHRRYLECISLLVSHDRIANRTAQLLWQLGQAYENANDLPNAVATYKRCLTLLAQPQSVPMRFARQDVEQRLARLQAKSG